MDKTLRLKKIMLKEVKEPKLKEIKQKSHSIDDSSRMKSDYLAKKLKKTEFQLNEKSYKLQNLEKELNIYKHKFSEMKNIIKILFSNWKCSRSKFQMEENIRIPEYIFEVNLFLIKNDSSEDSLKKITFGISLRPCKRFNDYYFLKENQSIRLFELNIWTSPNFLNGIEAIYLKEGKTRVLGETILHKEGIPGKLEKHTINFDNMKSITIRSSKSRGIFYISFKYNEDSQKVKTIDVSNSKDILNSDEKEIVYEKSKPIICIYGSFAELKLEASKNPCNTLNELGFYIQKNELQ